jgi:sodium-dependent dicarboxylate transporter 2/3/5
MAVWWLTEAIDISATALIPLIAFPLLGALDIADAAAPYAHPLIFLFMGGFILALSMQRWGLHERIALLTIRIVGAQPNRIIAGFMIATAIMSMWVSNTATVVMMLPVALSVLALAAKDENNDSGSAAAELDKRNFPLALLLGVAYAASIGGIGTIVGSPPNLFVVSYLQETGTADISFVGWMLLGIPLVVLFLPIVWLVLTRWLYPSSGQHLQGIEAHIAESYSRQGPMNRGEIVTVIVFSVTVLLWLTRPLLNDIQIGGSLPFSGLTDTGIAMSAALALFLIPVNWKERTFVMDWKHAEELPWGILILFGGGLSLARAIDISGVGEIIGEQLDVLSGAPLVLVILTIVVLMIFLTELTSNTATTATLVPIIAGLAPVFGVNAVDLVIPAAISANCAFMMPVATPPNAIVFASGHVSIPAMARAGLRMNFIGIVLIFLLALFLFPVIVS